jgi:nucleoside-diphosphate-sugar epimerase
MSILITGVNGFIGKNLFDTLSCASNTFKFNKLNTEKVYGIGRKEKYISNSDVSDKISSVLGLSCKDHNYIGNVDIMDLPRLKDVFDTVNPDVVIHCAANPIVKHNDNDHNGLINTNIIGTNNIIHCMKPHTKIIFMSSIVLYDEKYKWKKTEASPVSPKSIYGATKYCCENLIQFYHEYKNIEYLILRLGATVGRFTTHGLIHDVIRKLADDNDKLELLNIQPGPHKPYTHIYDVCSAVCTLLSNNKTGIYNVTNNDPISVEDVALTIMKKLNIQKEIIWLDKNWIGDNNYLAAENVKLVQDTNIKFLKSKDAISLCI